MRVIKFFIIFFIIFGWIFSGRLSFNLWTSDVHRFGVLPEIQVAQAAVVTVSIKSPAEEDCDVGDSPVSPANPLCGFIPRTVTITAGDTIRWVNNDSVRSHQPSSDPHPEHTTYVALNMPELSPGAEATSGSLTKVGTWNYHDHLDVSFLGSITIAAPSSSPSPSGGSGGGCYDCTTPIVISHQVLEINHKYATVIWTTDEPSLTHLEFGTTTAYGTQVNLNGIYRVDHMVTLENLLSATKYFYQIYVEDKIGNKDFSHYPDQFFSTLPIIPEITTTSTPTLTPSLVSAEEKIKEMHGCLSELNFSLFNLYRKQGFRFTARLGIGSRGDETKLLQIILTQDPTFYPEGLITGYFGPLTEEAVKRFQKKNNIINLGNSVSTGYGLVGPKTRTKLNELLNK